MLSDKGNAKVLPTISSSVCVCAWSFVSMCVHVLTFREANKEHMSAESLIKSDIHLSKQQSTVVVGRLLRFPLYLLFHLEAQSDLEDQ